MINLNFRLLKMKKISLVVEWKSGNFITSMVKSFTPKGSLSFLANPIGSLSFLAMSQSQDIFTTFFNHFRKASLNKNIVSFINFILVPRVFCLFDLHFCWMKKMQITFGMRSTYLTHILPMLHSCTPWKRFQGVKKCNIGRIWVYKTNKVNFQFWSQAIFFPSEIWIKCISEIKETPCNRN